MKKFILLLALFLSLTASAQPPATGTAKSGKYQMNIPDTGILSDSVCVWNGSSKLIKVVPRSIYLSGIGVQDLDQTLTIGNKTGEKNIESDNGDSVLEIKDAYAKISNSGTYVNMDGDDISVISPTTITITTPNTNITSEIAMLGVGGSQGTINNSGITYSEDDFVGSYSANNFSLNDLLNNKAIAFSSEGMTFATAGNASNVNVKSDNLGSGHNYTAQFPDYATGIETFAMQSYVDNAVDGQGLADVLSNDNHTGNQLIRSDLGSSSLMLDDAKALLDYEGSSLKLEAAAVNLVSAGVMNLNTTDVININGNDTVNVNTATFNFNGDAVATTAATNAYADAKVEDNLTPSTTVAPSKTAVNTALSGKQSTLTNSAGLAAALSNETGTGLSVFNDTPTLLTPTIAAINGGTASNDDITIQGTTNATRTTSYVNLQPNGGKVGIGTSAPAAALDIRNSTISNNWIIGGTTSGSYGQLIVGEGISKGTYFEMTRFANAYPTNPGMTILSNLNKAFLFSTSFSGTYRNDLSVSSAGNVGVGVAASVSSAKLHLMAGTATAGTASLKINSGTVLTTTEAGAIENDGTHLYYTATNGGTRYQLDRQVTAGSFSGVGTATTTFTVTIGSTMANTTYKVTATPTNVLSAAVFYVTNKTTTTFDVVYLAGLSGTVGFDWHLVP